MANPLIECIPNFSEARRPEVVQKILAAMQAISGAVLLDYHSDTDHNRTVVTLIGSPQALEEAAFQGIRTAAELIDMDQHTGEHPRIGATDVVPFVPLQDFSMAECVALARRLAERVASELEIPVYLYEEAAIKKERSALEDIRRGQYEGLKEVVLTDPQRVPDFGPARLGKAGATVIGAREALIAFNVYLNSEDVEIAKKIAKTVRFSSGGFRFVKAMGVLVDGRAQVSMNLTNYKKTAIAQVVELIRREAERFGTTIHHSELVGLLPQQALIDTAVWYTQLNGFTSDQVLESRLSNPNSMTGSNRWQFLDELAADTPTPGGGSAAAYTAAQAASLAAMVGKLTFGKKKYADVEKGITELIGEAEKLKEKLITAVDEDARAFDEVMAAMRLPKETELQKEERESTLQKATLQAAQVPLETARMALQVMQICVRAAAIGNVNAITDAASGAAFAKAAITACSLNVYTNIAALKDKTVKEGLKKELREIHEQILVLDEEIVRVLKTRADIAYP